MTIGERIKTRREALGMSVDDVAFELGKNRATVYRYENGDIKKMSIDVLEPLARVLHTTPAYLMGWDDDPYDWDLDEDVRLSQIPIAIFDELKRLHPDDMAAVWDAWLDMQKDAAREAVAMEAKERGVPPGFEPLPQMVKRPLVGSIACGTPITAEQNVESYVDVPAGVHCDFCLRCKGDSMIDAGIRDNDIVYIRIQPEVENGEIAAVRIGEEATLKQVYYDGESVMLIPANRNYLPKTYRGAELADIHIEGKAVGYTHWY